MQKRRVVVTGVGIISPNGVGKEAWAKLPAAAAHMAHALRRVRVCSRFWLTRSAGCRKSTRWAIFMEKVRGADLWIGLTIQAGWVIICFLAARLMWRAGLRPRVRLALDGEHDALQALLQGKSLADVLDTAPALDFGLWLPLAVQSGLVLGVTPIDAASNPAQN